jgi:hypothetical protein
MELVIKIEAKIDNTLLRVADREMKLDEVLFDKPQNKFKLYDVDNIVADLDYVGNSRIDGYPIFKVYLKDRQHIPLGNCKLMYSNLCIAFSEITIVKPLEDNIPSYINQMFHK